MLVSRGADETAKADRSPARASGVMILALMTMLSTALRTSGFSAVEATLRRAEWTNVATASRLSCARVDSCDSRSRHKPS